MKNVEKTAQINQTKMCTKIENKPLKKEYKQLLTFYTRHAP